ncbi:hypothetical protein HXX76_012141 [Chlamydomonas incerta]|uniref:Uncharacterized protein n=1 Tax=Chlamydomonas incerta TaxID=51695 RepID=A0A835ST65_CHLIN|nr:hypothetical protein HXX76_012141 [Chlamydomonas incerta]|eukprot:KAG2427819.1 hypothetical protein HXX76_012141 [Chlamydomonas incerta]
MVKDFVRLLEEKQELDATDDEEEGAPAGAAAAADAEESEESDEDEEDEGEEESEDDDDEEEEEEEELEPEVLAALQRLQLGATGGKATAGKPAAAAGPAPPGLGAAQRKAMRAGLVASIKHLKEVEQMQKLAADDPLLGA